jgi:hypothetical protein
VRREIRPGVGARRDLGERADREPTRSFDEHGGRVCGRCVEREPVLGVARRRPQLPAPFERAARSFPELHQHLPLARVAARVDQAQELVEITTLDGLADAISEGN